MALAFPFLVAAVVVLVEFVLYVHAESVVVGAVLDGARVAAEDGATLQDGVDRADAVLQAGLGAGASAVTTRAGVEGRDVVVVRASGQFSLVLPGAGANPRDAFLSLPLQGLARMTKEGFRPRGEAVAP